MSADPFQVTAYTGQIQLNITGRHVIAVLDVWQAARLCADLMDAMIDVADDMGQSDTYLRDVIQAVGRERGRQGHLELVRDE